LTSAPVGRVVAAAAAGLGLLIFMLHFGQRAFGSVETTWGCMGQAYTAGAGAAVKEGATGPRASLITGFIPPPPSISGAAPVDWGEGGIERASVWERSPIDDSEAFGLAG
jgi:hypothetical protein